MTTTRSEGPTPNGGDYALATYVLLETMEEVDEAAADGIVVSEYTDAGEMICETVASIRVAAPAPAVPAGL
jgi:hypothetical protein